MLATTGVTPGSYTAADITVNDSGQITSAASNSIVASGGGGPKITNVQITDNAYTVIDDTAVALTGGYIKIVGTGFVTGCQVIIGSLVVTSVSYISATEVRAQVPAQAAGTYTVYLVNSDGGVAIRVNGLNYSAMPTWSTTSPLPDGVKDTAISIQLVATSNSGVTFALQSGSTLPSGLTLSSSGLLSGTVTGISVNTTYNFTIVAIDAEAQDTPQAFQITIVIGDPFYRLVTLHLPGTGTNLKQNNTFLDASTNNFTITRNGNATQGTFSPFSQTGWGAYFDGTGDLISTPTGQTNLTLATSDFTIEGFFYITAQVQTDPALFTSTPNISLDNSIMIQFSATNLRPGLFVSSTNLTASSTNNYVIANQWNHIAVCRTGGSVYSFYINGVAVNNVSSSSASITTNSWRIGYWTVGGNALAGNISNFRIIKGTALYSGATITVPTAPLTAVANTQLLILQDNRFIDRSSNNYTLTITGDTRITPFSPFNPSASWSAATYGGSGYFDGSGDYLSVAYDALLNIGTGDFCVEAWVYKTSASGNDWKLISGTDTSTDMFIGDGGTTSSRGLGWGTTGGWAFISGVVTPINEWAHICFTRLSGVGRIFLNGYMRAYTASNSTNLTLNNAALRIGGERLLAYMFTGSMGYLRISKGSVPTEYQTSVTSPSASTLIFTPPTSPVTTTSQGASNVQLLLNFTNAGIYDATAKNVLETVGDAKISTAQSKWGGSSMSFDGTGDWLQTPVQQNFVFGTGDFTVEFWIYANALSGYQNIFDGRAVDATLFPVLWLHNTALELYVNGSVRVSSAITTSTWYHVALSRSGTSTKLFINGTQVGSTYTDSNNYVAGSILYLSRYAPSAQNYLNGYIQDVRITRGYARYTANFTPPTGAFPVL